MKMKMHKGAGAKACALLLTGVLGMSCLATACSGDDVAKAADTESPQPIAVSVEPAAMQALPAGAATTPESAADHWSATLSRDSLTLKADLDVTAQQKSAYPVRQTSQLRIDQEMVDKVLALVAPDAQFTVDDFTMTKADIQREIESVQACLEEDRASGDKTCLEADQQRLEELQTELQSAPDAVEERIWDGRLYTDDAHGDEAPYASVTSRNPDGTCRLFCARLTSPGDLTSQQFLYYGAADYMIEQEDRASWGEVEDPGTQKRLALYAENGMDEEAVVQQLARTLSGLGITAVEATRVDKALWAPRRELTDEQAAAMKEEPAPDELDSHAVYVDFAACADGLAGTVPGDSGPGDGAPVAPYDAMTGFALVAEDGTILQLSISGSGLMGDATGEDQAIQSLPELQDKIADALVAATSDVWIDEVDPAEEAAAAEPAAAPTYTVEDARLGYALIADPTDPAAARAVPAWTVQVTSEDSNACSYLDLVVSALDGQRILCASSAVR